MSAPAAQAARRQGLLWGLVGAVVWAPALTLALRESDRLFDHAVFGADFASFHAASRLTLGGAPAQVYDVARHWAAQTEAMTTSGYAYFLYPPLYLLLCWPLGLAPFFVALASWLSLGFAACALALRRIAPPQGPLAGLPPLIAAPAAMMNAAHGQNAFLTTALMAAGGLALARRPVLAGLCFGALAFKPQLGLLLPALLLASGRLRAFFAAAGATAAFALAATAAFGVEIWRAWLDALPLARRVLEDGHVEPEKLQSVFAMLRLAGAPLDLAYAGQAGAALIVCATVVVAARRAQPLAGVALVAAGAALTTPFVLRYDLMILLIPLAWLARDGARAPLRPWELAAAGLAYLAPLVPLDLAAGTGALVAPPILALFFAMIARRVLANEKGEPEGSPQSPAPCAAITR